MKIKLNIIILFLIIIFSSNKINALENKIIFKVNNEIITSVDVLNEIEYLSLLNKNLYELEEEIIYEIAKNSLIKEKIKKIELSKYFEKLEIEEKYYELFMNDFIKKIKLKSLKDLEILIANKNLKMKDIESKLIIELLWNQLILNKFSRDVKIDKKKIKDEIIKNNFQNEYFISEIVFNLDKDQKLQTKLNKIINEINTNGFSNAALLYSISNSSTNGGKLGWVKLSSLNSKIKNQIKKTKKNSFTEPIVIPGGFIILKVEDIRETKIITDIDKEIESIANQVGNKQLNQFSIIYFNKLKKEVVINAF
tara:strand:- start:466 stop:1392 length:927 start_codon:yes stop_codon:yes gene_type:complete